MGIIFGQSDRSAPCCAEPGEIVVALPDSWFGEGAVATPPLSPFGPESAATSTPNGADDWIVVALASAAPIPSAKTMSRTNIWRIATLTADRRMILRLRGVNPITAKPGHRDIVT